MCRGGAADAPAPSPEQAAAPEPEPAHAPAPPGAAPAAAAPAPAHRAPPTGRARVRLLYEEYVHLPRLQAVWATPLTCGPGVEADGGGGAGGSGGGQDGSAPSTSASAAAAFDPFAPDAAGEARLEPIFAAAMHGVELGLLLLAEFVGDARPYVAKRPRVEAVAEDVAAQCRLLADVVDAELEEEDAEGGEGGGGSGGSSGAPAGGRRRRALAGAWPFPGAPPAAAAPARSPGAARLEAALHAALAAAPPPAAAGLRRVVGRLTAAFSAFEAWGVGLGLEPQLARLRAAVGLAPGEPAVDGGGGDADAPFAADSTPADSPTDSTAAVFHYPCRRARFLDYAALVRPEAAEATLSAAPRHASGEDFFFRTVHLGAECWARPAAALLAGAAAAAATRRWRAAAARAGLAARVLCYLGDHVLLLTSMNLRDYLRLKVELEGTSGEGSAAVRALRPAARALLAPLAAALLALDLSSADGAAAETSGAAPLPLPPPPPPGADAASTPRLHAALLRVYARPESYPDLYGYARALEDLEAGLLVFFYKHFRLAASVIGSDARGTMRRAVSALKSSYETPLFPELDAARSGLGAAADAALAPRKGALMAEILERYSAGGAAEAAVHAAPAPAANGCPFGFGRAADGAAAAPPVPAAPPSPPADADNPAAALAAYYSWEPVPPESATATAASISAHAAALRLAPRPAAAAPAGPAAAAPLAFLSHALGAVPPAALHRVAVDLAAFWALGNDSWRPALGPLAAEAAAEVRALLELDGGGACEGGAGAVAVHWGHNSHELVTRLLSAALLDRGGTGAASGSSGDTARCSPRPLRVLVSDEEFLSLSRQLARWAAGGAAEPVALAAAPAATFSARATAAARAAAAAGRPFDAVYASQVVYL
jgi:tryptophan 2,3-dioxygenase